MILDHNALSIPQLPRIYVVHCPAIFRHNQGRQDPFEDIVDLTLDETDLRWVANQLGVRNNLCVLQTPSLQQKLNKIRKNPVSTFRAPSRRCAESDGDCGIISFIQNKNRVCLHSPSTFPPTSLVTKTATETEQTFFRICPSCYHLFNRNPNDDKGKTSPPSLSHVSLCVSL